MTPLRQRYLEDMQVRHLSPTTQRLYAECVALYARHFGKSPERLGPEDIRAYQLSLVHETQVSWSRFNQRVCARRFLYRVTLGKDWAISHLPFPRREHKLPVVLSPAEVAQFLGALTRLKDSHGTHDGLCRWAARLRSAPPAGVRHRFPTHDASHPARQRW